MEPTEGRFPQIYTVFFTSTAYHNCMLVRTDYIPGRHVTSLLSRLSEGRSALSSGLRKRKNAASLAELFLFSARVLCRVLQSCMTDSFLGRGIYLQVSLRDYPGFKSCGTICKGGQKTAIF